MANGFFFSSAAIDYLHTLFEKGFTLRFGQVIGLLTHTRGSLAAFGVRGVVKIPFGVGRGDLFHTESI